MTLVKYPGTGCRVGCRYCYVAVVIQFLARLDELVELADRQLAHEERRFLRLLLDIRNKIEMHGDLIDVDDILQLTSLDISEQQDVHELLTICLDMITRELDGQYMSAFNDLFKFEISRRVGKMVYRETMSILEISLDTACDRDTVSINDLLAYDLEHCVVSAPSRLLIVYVIRTTGNMEKTMTDITWTRQLDISSYSGPQYTLIGIVYHEGESIHHGHFFATFFEDSTTICIDGARCMFIEEDDVEMQDRIHRAQEVIFIYGHDVHLRCWFPSFERAQMLQSSDKIIEQPEPSSKSHNKNLGTRLIQQHFSRALIAHQRFGETLTRLLQENSLTEARRHLTLVDKFAIIFWLSHGVPTSKIAAKLGRSPSTVTRFLESPIMLETCKRTNILENEQVLKIVLKETMKAQRLSSAKLASKVNQRCGLLLSKETIRKLRRKVGLRFLAPIPKAKLSDNAKTTRVVFATHWITNGQHTLRGIPIIFSDESMFIIGDNSRKLWRIPGECRESDYIQVQQHPCSVMVWGAIGFGYKSELLAFDENCNQRSYIDLLEKNKIIDHLNNIYGERQYLFQQDNAPPHVAKSTIAWLEKKVFLLKNWPPHSPDLSPIEMMWAIAKSKMDTDGVTTKEELFARVKEVWNSIPLAFVNNMVSSFEARLRAVCHLRGDSLNGHWVYVHRIHTLIKTVPRDQIDSEVERLHSRDSQSCDVHDRSEEDSPLLQLSRLESDLSHDCLENDEEESSSSSNQDCETPDEFVQSEEEESSTSSNQDCETPDEFVQSEEEESFGTSIQDFVVPNEIVHEVCPSNSPRFWTRVVNVLQSTATSLLDWFTYSKQGFVEQGDKDQEYNTDGSE